MTDEQEIATFRQLMSEHNLGYALALIACRKLFDDRDELMATCARLQQRIAELEQAVEIAREFEGGSWNKTLAEIGAASREIAETLKRESVFGQKQEPQT